MYWWLRCTGDQRTTHRRAQAVSQFVSQGELEVAGGQVHAVVLQRHQAGVQAGLASVPQGGVLGTNPSPVAWRQQKVEGGKVSMGS